MKKMQPGETSVALFATIKGYMLMFKPGTPSVKIKAHTP